MKSTIKILLLAVLFLIPLGASAQQRYVTGNEPYVQNTNTSYTYGLVSTSGGFNTGYAGNLRSCTGAGIGCFGAQIVYIINNILVPVLFAVAFMVFLYGIAKTYIFSHGDGESVTKGHQLILWGLIGFVAMVSLWGMVNVVSNTFGLEGVNTPDLPTSY